MKVLLKPVKTHLMDSIKAVLEGISEISQVKQGQGVPTDQDTATYPWCCFFDEIETKTRMNRVALKAFDLVIQVWVQKGEEEVDPQMDVIDAKIEAALLTNSDVLYYGRNIEPTNSDKIIVDEKEVAILQAIYRIDYMHTWKNPYSLEKI